MPDSCLPPALYSWLAGLKAAFLKLCVCLALYHAVTLSISLTPIASWNYLPMGTTCPQTILLGFVFIHLAQHWYLLSLMLTCFLVEDVRMTSSVWFTGVPLMSSMLFNKTRVLPKNQCINTVTRLALR